MKPLTPSRTTFTTRIHMHGLYVDYFFLEYEHYQSARLDDYDHYDDMTQLWFFGCATFHPGTTWGSSPVEHYVLHVLDYPQLMPVTIVNYKYTG